jgi:H+/Cl- antiporter ClcA
MVGAEYMAMVTLFVCFAAAWMTRLMCIRAQATAHLDRNGP